MDKKKRRIYQKEYNQRPEVKEKKRIYQEGYRALKFEKIKYEKLMQNKRVYRKNFKRAMKELLQSYEYMN